MGRIAGFCPGLFLSAWFLIIHQSTQRFFIWCLCLKKAKEQASRILSTFVQNWHNVTSAALCGQKVKVQPDQDGGKQTLPLDVRGNIQEQGCEEPWMVIFADSLFYFPSLPHFLYSFLVFPGVKPQINYLY